jgi:hypothetical protein
MSDYAFILDEMLWSYSRVETFERCAQCFYLSYILKKDQIPGFFGEYGSFGHLLLEKYYKEELFDFELADEYTNNYNSNITAYAPPNKFVNLADKYYQQGKYYFENFKGLDSDYETLGVESKYEYKIGDYNFTGIIDLELKHKEGWYEIIDHKSKSEQHKNKLTKKSNPDDFVQLVDGRFIPFDLTKQLYLYCIPTFEKYGEYPKYINFNMFKINDWYKFEFRKEDFEKSVQWVISTIQNLYKETKWLKGEDVGDFWCSFVCGQTCNCKYSNRFIDFESQIYKG